MEVQGKPVILQFLQQKTFIQLIRSASFHPTQWPRELVVFGSWMNVFAISVLDHFVPIYENNKV